MFKYFIQWFHDFMNHGQHIVGGHVHPDETFIQPHEEIEEETENSVIDERIPSTSLNPIMNRSIHRSSDPRELPRPLRKKKSFFTANGLSENRDLTKKNILRRKLRHCYTNCGCVDKVEENEETGLYNNEEKTQKEMKKEDKNEKISNEICWCKNCSVIVTMSECPVCFEPLQTRGVTSCSICANLVCVDCAAKLKNCAFCRAGKSMQKNRAIERFLDKLYTPCKNFRSGCRKLVNSETRSRHETICNHASFICPAVKSTCGWQGRPTEILNHLRKIHSLQPLVLQKLIVEILSFRMKSMTGRVYIVYLLCYNQLFTCNVTLCQQKLIISFTKLGYVTRTTEKMLNDEYGVWININGAGKHIKSEFGKLGSETFEIQITGNKLFPSRDERLRIDDKIDKLEIEICVKKINDMSETSAK